MDFGRISLPRQFIIYELEAHHLVFRRLVAPGSGANDLVRYRGMLYNRR